MDEAEWWSSTDPQAMLEFLQGQVSTRRLRRFAYACGRRYCVIREDAGEDIDYYRRLKPAANAQCGHVIDAAERWEDGQESSGAVEALREHLCKEGGLPMGLMWDLTATVKGDAAYWIKRYEDNTGSAREQASQDAKDVWGRYRERVFQAGLIRDLVGNPFRPPSPLDPSVIQWNNGTVKRLAEEAYEHRVLPAGTLDSLRLSVLADAMEEAGADAQLVEHLRDPGPHVRGCFVLDLLLGKS